MKVKCVTSIIKHLKLTISALMIATVNNAVADEIVIGSDPWCPYICEPNTNAPGIIVEITINIMEKAGHKVVYKKLPWTRAEKDAHTGKINGIFGATKVNAAAYSPFYEFPFEEQAHGNDCFFVYKTDAWRYRGFESLNGITIGTIKNYTYPSMQSYIDQYRNDPARIQTNTGDSALDKNIKKLIKRRITAVLEDEAVFLYTIKKFDNKDDFVLAGCEKGTPEVQNLYVAFTPASINARSIEYAKILSDGMIKIRKSGELAVILEKYGVKDWK